MIKLSIIIPVHNSEKHIEKCINSILNQTVSDFELIIIDDGSTDQSYEIIKNLIKEKRNIYLYHQSNKGVSATRNLGILKAKGEYITFVDSDDYINKNFVEFLISKVNYNSWDCVISGLSYIYKYKEKVTIHLEDKEWIPKNPQEWILFYKTKLLTSPVAKLYKKDIIIKYNIRFDTELSFAEDRDFNISYLSHTNKFLVCNYQGYNYNKDVENSLSQKRPTYKLKNDYKYWNKLFQHISNINNGIYNDSYLANLLYHFTIDNYIELFKYNSYKNANKIINDSQLYFNKEYIINNLNLINAPKWQKFLFSTNHKILLFSLFLIARIIDK